jgi:hypothetical protein
MTYVDPSPSSSYSFTQASANCNSQLRQPPPPKMTTTITTTIPTNADQSGTSFMPRSPSPDDGLTGGGIVSYFCTLRINKGPASPFNRRLISLHPGDHIVLGRVSKNQKTEFTSKSTNGYFDNPIISRRHAYLQNRAGLVLPPKPLPFGCVDCC